MIYLMNAARQEQIVEMHVKTFLNCQKQVVSDVTLGKEKRLLFKNTVMNTKCFIYYIIFIKNNAFLIYSITLLL